MRLVVQRAKSAAVEVAGEVVGEIGRGLLVLVGFGAADTDPPLVHWREKLFDCRIFPNGEKHFDSSLRDIGGDILLVSQFTLFADTRKGRRPSFSGAMAPENAEPLYNEFVHRCRENAPGKVATGIFGAMMSVSLINEGPVTLLFDDGA